MFSLYNKKIIKNKKKTESPFLDCVLCFIYYCDVKLAKSKLYLIHGSDLIKTDSNRLFIPSIGVGP